MIIPKPPKRIRRRRGKEYTAWRQDWLSRHAGPRKCAGVWKRGVKVQDCVQGGVEDEIGYAAGLWRYLQQRLELCHIRGRSTHFGVGAKMTDAGVVDGCHICNAISAGNKIVREV